MNDPARPRNPRHDAPPERAPSEGAPPDAGAPAWLARLRRVLSDQIDAALSLEHLSQVHSKAIDSGEPENVLAVLAQREPVIERLRAGALELDPFVNARGDGAARPVDTLGMPQRAEVRAELARLGAILERITQRDERDRAALEARRTAVADELAGLAAGRHASSAYAPGRVEAPRPTYQDRSA